MDTEYLSKEVQETEIISSKIAVLLAREGFVEIRHLIDMNQFEKAREVADALHNLPVPEDRDARFQSYLTVKDLRYLVSRNEHLKRRFSLYLQL